MGITDASGRKDSLLKRDPAVNAQSPPAGRNSASPDPGARREPSAGSAADPDQNPDRTQASAVEGRGITPFPAQQNLQIDDLLNHLFRAIPSVSPGNSLPTFAASSSHLRLARSPPGLMSGPSRERRGSLMKPGDEII